MLALRNNAFRDVSCKNTNAFQIVSDCNIGKIWVGSNQRTCKWDIDTQDQTQPCFIDVAVSLRVGKPIRLSLLKVERGGRETYDIGDGLHRQRGMLWYFTNRIPSLLVCYVDQQTLQINNAWADIYCDHWIDEPPVFAYKIWYSDAPQDTPNPAKRASVSQHLKSALYSSQSGRCKICDKNVDAKLAEYDHTIPLANCTYDAMPDCMLCSECHRSKTRDETYVQKDHRLTLGDKRLTPYVEAAVRVIETHDCLRLKILKHSQCTMDITGSHYVRNVLEKFVRSRIVHRVLTEDEKNTVNNCDVFVEITKDLSETEQKLSFSVDNRNCSICQDDSMRVCEHQGVQKVIHDQELNMLVGQTLHAVVTTQTLPNATVAKVAADEYDKIITSPVAHKPNSRKTVLLFWLAFLHRDCQEHFVRTQNQKDDLTSYLPSIPETDSAFATFKHHCADFLRLTESFSQKWTKPKLFIDSQNRKKYRQWTYSQSVPYFLLYLHCPENLERLFHFTIDNSVIEPFFWDCTASGFWCAPAEMRATRKGALMWRQYLFLRDMLQSNELARRLFHKVQADESVKKRKYGDMH